MLTSVLVFLRMPPMRTNICFDAATEGEVGGDHVGAPPPSLEDPRAGCPLLTYWSETRRVPTDNDSTNEWRDGQGPLRVLGCGSFPPRRLTSSAMVGIDSTLSSTASDPALTASSRSPGPMA